MSNRLKRAVEQLAEYDELLAEARKKVRVMHAAAINHMSGAASDAPVKKKNELAAGIAAFAAKGISKHARETAPSAQYSTDESSESEEDADEDSDDWETTDEEDLCDDSDTGSD